MQGRQRAFEPLVQGRPGLGQDARTGRALPWPPGRRAHAAPPGPLTVSGAGSRVGGRRRPVRAHPAGDAARGGGERVAAGRVVAEHVHGRRGGGEQHGVAGPGQGGGGPGRPGHAAHARVGVQPVVAHRPIVTPAHVEDGDLGGVSRQRGVDTVAVAAQDDGPGEPVAVGDDELADVGALEQAARHPDHAGVRGEGRGGGVRVGGLRVVDPPHPAGLGHHGTAVRAGGDRAQPGGDRLGRHPVRAGQGRRGQGVQPRRAGRAGRRRRSSARTTPSPNARSTRCPSTIPSSPGPGSPRVKPTWRGAGAAIEQRGGLAVVEARDRDVAAQHPGLRRAVGGHRAVPVEVVLGEVEHRPGEGAHRRRPLELEARQLHGQHPVARRAARPRSGRPMLPQATVSSPAARRIASSIVVVVVLPLVPVTASQRGGPSGQIAGSSPSHQASSGSPTIGTDAARAASASGESVRKPGLVTTRSAPVGQRGQLPRAGHRAGRRAASSCAWSPSATVTRAPRCSSTSTTETPVRRAPATSTCRSGQLIRPTPPATRCRTGPAPARSRSPRAARTG